MWGQLTDPSVYSQKAQQSIMQRNSFITEVSNTYWQLVLTDNQSLQPILTDL